MTDKENGTNMIGHSDDPFGSSEETGRGGLPGLPSMTFGNRQPDTRISANISENISKVSALRDSHVTRW